MMCLSAPRHVRLALVVSLFSLFVCHCLCANAHDASLGRGHSALCRGCCFGFFMPRATAPPCPVCRQPVVQEGLIVSDDVARGHVCPTRALIRHAH
jgi:hypothetical protein